MPVEVRELVIKTTITQGGKPALPEKTAPSSNNGVSPAEEIISGCIERILEILKEKNGR